MESGRLYNKKITAKHGTNVTNSSEQAFPMIDVPTVPAASSNNLQYAGEDDSQKVLSGAGGDGGAGSPESDPIRWGYTAPSGSRIEVNDTGGTERIDIVHRSGAGVTIDPDGAIFIVSQSARGGGITAPLGDVMITAGGDIVIKAGGGLTIQTPGDLNMDVGGSLNIKSTDFNLKTNNYNAVVDGPASTNITNDQSVVVGGIDRKSVAGDQREQTTGKRITDVGKDYVERVGENFSLDVQGTSTHTIKGDQKYQSSAKTSVISSEDIGIDSGENIYVKASNDIGIDSSEDISVKSSDDISIHSGQNISIRSTDDIDIDSGEHLHTKSGNQTTLDSTESFIVRSASSVGISAESSIGIITDEEFAAYGQQAARVFSDGSTIFGGKSSTQLVSESGVLIQGSTTEIHGSTITNKSSIFLSKPITGDGGSASPGTVPSGAPAESPDSPVAPDSPESPAEPEEAKDAEVMEANDIVDSLTSARKYPEYPGNGVHESSNATGLGKISHDQMTQAEDVFNEYSGGNQGNINPSQEMDVFDTLPAAPINRDPNITAVDVDLPIPARNALGTKISKYFTLGQIINGTTTSFVPTPSNWESVVKQGMRLATNVLDPIKERFPDILVTSWYRTNSSNHISGRAIDIVVESRSMTKHAEIARFARDTLPVDQVFIEKNNSGRTHVHLRVSQGGSSGAPSVLTCGDPECKSRVAGIQVAWLARKLK